MQKDELKKIPFKNFTSPARRIYRDGHQYVWNNGSYKIENSTLLGQNTNSLEDVNFNLYNVILSYLDDDDYMRLCSVEDKVHLELCNYIQYPSCFSLEIAKKYLPRMDYFRHLENLDKDRM